MSLAPRPPVPSRPRLRLRPRRRCHQRRRRPPARLLAGLATAAALTATAGITPPSAPGHPRPAPRSQAAAADVGGASIHARVATGGLVPAVVSVRPYPLRADRAAAADAGGAADVLTAAAGLPHAPVRLHSALPDRAAAADAGGAADVLTAAAGLLHAPDRLHSALPDRAPGPPVAPRSVQQQRPFERAKRPGARIRQAAGRSLPVRAGGRGGPAAQPGPEVPGAGTHVPPTAAPIVDPFRPPANRYAAGNRGIEYATSPGTPIGASADGTVVFAGQVGGTLHVTVAHAGGVRTSYSFLQSIDVVRGQTVRQGDRLGAASNRLHFGARLGDAYFDPALLFASGPVEVELVPFEVPPGSTPEAEVRALAEIALDGGGPGLPDLDVLGDVGGWLRDRAETATHQVRQLSADRLIDLATDLTRRVLDPGPCDGREPPRRPAATRQRGPQSTRVAVTVAGLGSSSTSGSIDELRTDDLGYADGDVLKFSYAGGKVPGTGEHVDVGTSDYTSADTQGDLAAAGERLADLVADVLAAEPGATVDVFAHSQGGVVTRLALLELSERGVDLDRLGTVATLGSPHQGADLATAVAGANTHVTGNLGLDALEAALGTGIDPDATAVRQLAETSDVVERLRRHGVPRGVRFLSIGARSDWVVAAPNTEVDGQTNVTVPVTGTDAHGALVASDEATAELARAIAGRPPGCEPVVDAIADVLAGHGISAAEDAGGLVARSIGP